MTFYICCISLFVMPPPIVKSIRDEIYYQYAKIISESAGFGKKNYRFIISKFKDLKSGRIVWSTSIREYLKERETGDECIYCGSKEKLTVDHILPLSRYGPDSPDNAVMVCAKCNSSKGSKRLYEWKGLDSKDEHHRIAEGKYLKLLYKLHELNGSLDVSDVMLLCLKCDMGQLCAGENSIGKLSVYCLEGCFTKKS